MLPSSHRNPMDTLVEITPSREEHLVDAFSAFIAAANRLEDSHRHLHSEVAQLRGELEERNRDLASSLADNERIRIALRQILDGLPCGVAVIDVQTQRFVLLNPEGRKLLALPENELAYCLPEWGRAAVEAACKSPQKHCHEQEISLETEGKNRWLEIRSIQMRDAASEVTPARYEQVILIMRDITGHKNAEQDRESARNIVALAEMATVLAHEIRNPLGSMELLARCLTEDPGLSEDSKQCVEHLQAGIRSLSATVNNALRFHTPGSSAMRPVEVASVLKNSLEFVRPLARQKGVGLKLEDNLNQAEILGDSEGLKQVVLNLYCNSLRHTPSGGEILISARLARGQNGRAAVIEFRDTGCGIEAQNLGRIFDAGFTTIGSSGLGLAVCRRIVEQHHGSISAQSEIGHGATFTVEIPAV